MKRSFGNSKKIISYFIAVLMLLCAVPFYIFTSDIIKDDSATTVYGYTSISSPGAITTNNNSVYYSGDDYSYIYASGQIDMNVNLNEIQRLGFIYSDRTDAPLLNSGDSYSVISDKNRSFSSNFNVKKGSYNMYVRAYALDNYGNTYYGNTVKVYVNSGSNSNGYVTTDEVFNITSYSADVKSTVYNYYYENNPNYYNYRIESRGVVYSAQNSTPGLNWSNSWYVTGNKNTGTETVNINNLSPNTYYYVRAYVKLDNGSVLYGNTKTFTTYTSGYNGSNNSSGYRVQTRNISDITSDSARAQGEIFSNGGYTIYERGFVYSDTSKTPTINDYRIYDNQGALGTYYMNLSNLQFNRIYYVRAYFRNSNNTFYGDSIEFTTVIQSTPKPTPKPTAKPSVSPNTTEKEMLPGTGNYTFSPNSPIKRADVAVIIYNLDNNPLSTRQPKIFSDVPTDYYAKPAIDYCTNNGFLAGYTDGSFHPESTINRAEMAQVLCEVYNLSGEGKSSFIDVLADEWYYDCVYLATEAGMIHGYEDKTYKPDRSTTRAEAVTLFSSAENRSLKPLSYKAFTDVPGSKWFHKYVMNASIPRP